MQTKTKPGFFATNARSEIGNNNQDFKESTADPESEPRQAAALPSRQHQEQRGAAAACGWEEEGEGLPYR